MSPAAICWGTTPSLANTVPPVPPMRNLKPLRSATDVVVPGILLARVEAEGDRRAEGEGLVLAEVVVRGGMAALHCAGLHRIEHLQPADDFPGREQLDVELAPGRLAHPLADQLGAPVEGIQALRPARSHPPIDGRLRLGNRWRGERACGDAGGRI